MGDLANKMHKGDYAIVHTEHTAYHLHTGHYHWSRYSIVRVAKASREGRVVQFYDYEGSAPKRVDRTTTIYALPQFVGTAVAECMFAKQECGFLGYEDKPALKAAINDAAGCTLI